MLLAAGDDLAGDALGCVVLARWSGGALAGSCALRLAAFELPHIFGPSVEDGDEGQCEVGADEVEGD